MVNSRVGADFRLLLLTTSHPLQAIMQSLSFELQVVNVKVGHQMMVTVNIYRPKYSPKSTIFMSLTTSPWPSCCRHAVLWWFKSFTSEWWVYWRWIPHIAGSARFEITCPCTHTIRQLIDAKHSWPRHNVRCFVNHCGNNRWLTQFDRSRMIAMTSTSARQNPLLQFN